MRDGRRDSGEHAGSPLRQPLDTPVKYWYTYDSLSRVEHKIIEDEFGNTCEENYEYDAVGDIFA